MVDAVHDERRPFSPGEPRWHRAQREHVRLRRNNRHREHLPGARERSVLIGSDDSRVDGSDSLWYPATCPRLSHYCDVGLKTHPLRRHFTTFLQHCAAPSRLWHHAVLLRRCMEPGSVLQLSRVDSAVNDGHNGSRKVGTLCERAGRLDVRVRRS